MDNQYLQIEVDEQGVVVAVLLDGNFLPFFQIDVNGQRVEYVEHLYAKSPPKLEGNLCCGQ